MLSQESYLNSSFTREKLTNGVDLFTNLQLESFVVYFLRAPPLHGIIHLNLCKDNPCPLYFILYKVDINNLVPSVHIFVRFIQRQFSTKLYLFLF